MSCEIKSVWLVLNSKMFGQNQHAENNEYRFFKMCQNRQNVFEFLFSFKNINLEDHFVIKHFILLFFLNHLIF